MLLKPASPPAIADQLAPFHLAMFWTAMPPARVNAPPATTSPFGITASACTPAPAPPMPLPKGTHAAPVHRAMPLALTPPAIVNAPPTTSSPLASTASAFTLPFAPAPKELQVPATGSKRARLFAGTLPALEKRPATTRCSPVGPTPSGSHSSSASTTPLTPNPVASCHCGAHCADAVPPLANASKPSSERDSERACEDAGQAKGSRRIMAGCDDGG